MSLFLNLRYTQNKLVFYFLFFWGIFSALLFSSCASVALKNGQVESSLKQEIQEAFDSEELQKKEIFRVLVSSEQYLRKQLQSEEIFSFREDESSDLAFCQELSVYDKINYKSKAIVKISLYQDSGTLSKIRFIRSSGISEIDKIIAEDITRWRFDFTTRKIPELFHISFYILLSSQVTREQAKEELKKFAQ